MEYAERIWEKADEAPALTDAEMTVLLALDRLAGHYGRRMTRWGAADIAHQAGLPTDVVMAALNGLRRARLVFFGRGLDWRITRAGEQLIWELTSNG